MTVLPKLEPRAGGAGFRARVRLGMRKLAGVLLPLLLSGCASASSAQIAPRTYSVECRRSQANCYREAARCCPEGFDVLDSAGRSKFIVVNNTNTSTVIPKYRGELLVRCNGEE